MKISISRVACPLIAVLFLSIFSHAVTSREIDKIRDRAVLSDSDFAKIDSFLSENISQYLSDEDFSNVSQVRSIILSKRESGNPSNESQYVPAYLDAASRHISRVYHELQKMEPDKTQFMARVNLLILAEGFADKRFVELGLKCLQDEKEAIRYWGVKLLVNPAVVNTLNEGGIEDGVQQKRIIEAFMKIVENNCCETLPLIARFAVQSNVSGADKLLAKILDIRIEAYENWKPKDTAVDQLILSYVCGELVAVENAELAMRFAQLYSYVIQRYVKGQDVLGEDDLEKCVWVIAEIEQGCIGKKLEMIQRTMREAIEQEDMRALMREHDKLLGSASRKGALAAKLSFDYGATGSAPKQLPDPPTK